MKITLLDALEGGELGAALRQALTSETLLADHRLREERFAPCQGCFECWVKHPGTCKAKAARRADLLVLASPVYIDCLPSLVLAGLGHLADAALDPPPALLPIIQCGFPELEHTALALEVVRRAARALGAPWAGHLALGGAGAIQVDHLDQRAGRMRHQVDALDQAAEALNAGRPLPIAASERFATPLLGARAYRAVGQVGWVVHALKEGAALRLWDKPFAPDEP